MSAQPLFLQNFSSLRIAYRKKKACVEKKRIDYYPGGMVMPNRQIVGGEPYRYSFQGQEKDPETGKEAFQLRLWDSRIGRWLTTDPYRQYASPYLGMGNDPINGIDPDGGYRTWFGAFLGWVGSGFSGGIDRAGGGGDKEWAISNTVMNENYGNDGDDLFFTIKRDYGSNFFVEAKVGGSTGLQAGIDVKAFGAKAAFSGQYNRAKSDLLGFGYSSKKGFHNVSDQEVGYNNLSSGYSLGIGVVGGKGEHYPSRGKYIPKKYHGQMKSEQISFPIYGTLKNDYNTSGNLLQTTRSWGVGADVKILMFGVHFNLDIGYKDIK